MTDHARSPLTHLVFLRGNSGSGKTSLARALQRRLGHGRLAVVSQDVVRRDVLRVPDADGNESIALIDSMSRHCLDRGMSVIVEGVLHPQRYGAMLNLLARAHRGATRAYFWDIPFDETLRRHATKSDAHEFGEPEMREWWYGSALVDGLDEHIIGPGVSLSAATELVADDCGWR